MNLYLNVQRKKEALFCQTVTHYNELLTCDNLKGTGLSSQIQLNKPLCFKIWLYTSSVLKWSYEHVMNSIFYNCDTNYLTFVIVKEPFLPFQKQKALQWSLFAVDWPSICLLSCHPWEHFLMRMSRAEVNNSCCGMGVMCSWPIRTGLRNCQSSPFRHTPYWCRCYRLF